MSQHENTDVVQKGDAKIGRGSSDSTATNNSVYSDAVEVSIAIFFYQIWEKNIFDWFWFLIWPKDPLTQENATLQLFKKIEKLTRNNSYNEQHSEMIQMLLGKLKERIEMLDHQHKSKIKSMQKSQENMYGKLLWQKNDEVTKLQTEIDQLKSNLKRASIPKSSNERDVIRLKEELKKRNEEMRQMTYKLIDAKTQISLLEKNKQPSKQSDINSQNVKVHFKTIERALLSNGNFMKMIQQKKMLSEAPQCLSDTEFWFTLFLNLWECLFKT